MAINFPKDFYNQYYTKDYYQSEPWEVAEERFRKRFQLHVEKSKRHYRHRPVPISYRSWSEANIPIPFEQEMQRESLLKVYISEEHYEYLVKREQQLEELERENHRFRKIERDTIDEMSVRTKNPAVQKAYEKYQMLLRLAR